MQEPGDSSELDAELTRLLRALQDPTWLVSQEAARALVRLGKPAVSLFIVALDDEEREVRRRAAHALGQLQEQSAVVPLIAALQSDDPSLRFVVINTLGEIGDERAIAPLVQTLKDESRNDQGSATQALTKIGTPAVPYLIEALQYPSVTTRTNAAYALANIGGEEVVEPLINALSDENADVRIAVIAALGYLGDERALPMIQHLSDTDFAYDEWEEDQVSDSARQAVAQIEARQSPDRTIDNP